jgi:membrane fusion protein (multidrug efflux system)
MEYPIARLTRRERKRDLTRARLYEAALDEFRHTGFDRSSVSRIARNAGVSRASFYFHFPTKEHVLLELQWGLQQEIAQRIAKSDSLLAALNALVEGLIVPGGSAIVHTRRAGPTVRRGRGEGRAARGPRSGSGDESVSDERLRLSHRHGGALGDAPRRSPGARLTVPERRRGMNEIAAGVDSRKPAGFWRRSCAIRGSMVHMGNWNTRMGLAVLVAAVGCSQGEVAKVVQAPPVATAPVVAVDLEERIEASGEIEARYHSFVAAEVSGQVTQIVRDEGESIASHTPVLEIDPQRRELELAAARARTAQSEAGAVEARRQTERIRLLHRRNAVSKSQLDEAETALLVAKADAAAQRAQLGVAEQALDDATVCAPFDGVVGRRLVSEGDFVQVGTRLVEIVSLDPIQVVFHLAEIDSGRVAVGQRVNVTVAPFPEEVFVASVDVVYPTIDPESRTLRVKATLENPGGRLRPGLFARADLGIRARSGVPMVPEEAVLQRSDGSVVFRLYGGERVERRVVATGEFRDGMIEIRNGLAVGDVVVTRGQTDLIDGAVVRVTASADANAKLANRAGDSSPGRP